MGSSQVSSQDIDSKIRRRVDQMENICGNIETLYDQGTPLFTRHGLQNISAQLDNLQDERFKERKIYLTGLDEVVVDITIETGRVVFGNEPPAAGCEIIWSDLLLRYCSIQELTERQDARCFDLKAAYLPIKLYYGLCNRHIVSGELIYPSGPSIASLAQLLNDTRQKWEISEQNRRLQNIILSKPLFITVNKVIGFACGSLTFGTKVQHRSTIQHALLSSLRDYLFEMKKSAEIQCYAQDPEYSSEEKQALKAIGIIVLDDPKAFLEVDSASIVISIAPDIPVKQIITDIARPAAIVWCKQREQTHNMADPSSPRVERMLSTEYIELDFPYHESVGDVALYLRIV